MVKHCLAAFTLVFLLNPSFESLFAQKQSCRPSIPLQLLFWSNSKFPYEIWSFGRSNFDQNQFKRVQFGYDASPVLLIPRRPRRRSPPRVAPTNLSHRAHAPVLISHEAVSVFSSSCSFVLEPCRAEPSRPPPAATPAILATPLQSFAPRPP